MNKFVTYTADGRITNVAVSNTTNPEYFGELVLVLAQDITVAPSTHYVFESVVHEIGSPSDSNHVFNYTTRQWEDPRTPETEWPLVRAQRSRLLAASDWTQLPDVPLATKDAWATYRQALRDITQQPDPFSIIWPPTP